MPSVWLPDTRGFKIPSMETRVTESRNQHSLRNCQGAGCKQVDGAFPMFVRPPTDHVASHSAFYFLPSVEAETLKKDEDIADL